MDKHAKIYVAGHRGPVGSALMRNPHDRAYTNFVTPCIRGVNKSTIPLPVEDFINVAC